MKTIQPFIDAAIRLWQENSPTSRIAILLLAVISTVAIGGVGYWSVQPSYVVLASGLDAAKTDRIIDALDKEGIDYQLSGAGGNLLVDKRSFARARLIVRNHGVADGGAEPSMLSGAFASPTERRNQARIQKQFSLAKTIQNLNVVQQADVHLNVPNRGPFERDQGKSTASVLLTLAPYAQLSNQQASSIAAMVAFAIEDLQPQDVQITDRDGRSYTLPDNKVRQINSQVEYIAEAERKLAKKAEKQLLHFLGFGNASVEVSLDLTFANGSRTTTKYDPEGAVPSEEDLSTETTTNEDVPERGVAGVAGNLQSRKSKSKTVASKTENIKTSYLVPKTEETEVNTTPVRNSLSVSVIVNSQVEGMLQEDGTLKPEISDKVSAIVKNAVGFKAEKDTISVEFLAFPKSEMFPETVPTGFDWQRLIEIIESSSLAIASLTAFVIGFLLLKRYRPAPKPTTSDATALSQNRNESVQQLSKIIQDNPDVFAEIVRTWVGAEEQVQVDRRKAG